MSASALMTVAVIGLDLAASDDWPWAVTLGVQVLSGAAAYGTALMVMHRERLQAFLSILRRARAEPMSDRTHASVPRPFYEVRRSPEPERRLLLISHASPPEPSVGSLRWEKMSRFVSESRTVLLVPPRSPRALSAALESLLRNPGERLRMGTAGEREVRASYHASTVVPSLEALYESLARRASR